MTRPPATYRRLWDMFNTGLWSERELQVDLATEVLVASGTNREDAEKIAAGAYDAWLAAGKIMGE